MIIIKAHIDEIEENVKTLEKSLLRQIEVGDLMSHRILDNDCMKLMHTIDCFKEIVEKIKSKNLKEWKAKQQS